MTQASRILESHKPETSSAADVEKDAHWYSYTTDYHQRDSDDEASVYFFLDGSYIWITEAGDYGTDKEDESDRPWTLNQTTGAWSQ